MPATSARIVPLMALASRDASAAAKLILPPSMVIVTRPVSACLSVPCGPLMVIWSAARCASTPLTRGTGIRATRDISFPASGNVANDLAADALRARLAVGHHALRRGHD